MRLRWMLAALLAVTAFVLAPGTAAPASPAFDDCVLPGAGAPLPDDNRKRWWGDEGRATDWERFVRPVGTVRAVMLFVDFPNARAQDNAAPYDQVDAYHDFLAPGAEWLRRSAYARHRLEITPVRRWYSMSRADAEYGIRRDMPLQTQARYMQEAVGLADADVDFSAYDLVYVVPSSNAREIALSPAFVDGSGTLVSADGTALRHGVTYGRDMWSWGYKILVHETVHTYGLPDLYLEPGDTHAPVRGWDLMGNIAGHAPDLLAWHKLKLGWLRDGQVACVTRPGTTTHRLAPVERPGGVKAVVIRTGETTAYAIESRRRIGHDAAACSTGALVYSIDSPLRSGQAPIRVIDATPGSAETPGCRDLDVATLRAGGASTLELPGGITVELVDQSPQQDTVRVTRRS